MTTRDRLAPSDSILSSEPRPAQRRRVQLLTSGTGPAATAAMFGGEAPPPAPTRCPPVPDIPASGATPQIATAAAPSGLVAFRSDVGAPNVGAQMCKPYGVAGAEAVADVHRLAAPAGASEGGVDVMNEMQLDEVALREQQSGAMAAAPAAAEVAASGMEEGEREGKGEGELPPCDCCPLCMHILYDPITTPCKHTFCGRCFRKWADVNRIRNGLWRPVTPAPAGDGGGGGSGGGNGRPVGQILPGDQSTELSESTVTCPLCRSQVPAHLTSDTKRAEEVLLRHPVAYAARGSEIAEELAQLAALRTVSKKLYVGNLHSMLPLDQAPRVADTPRNRHCWTFFIRMDSEREEREFIERVVVHLHHTFNPSVVLLTEPPFLVRRVGWGIFVVRAEVHFKERWRHPPIWCRWLLEFDGMGDMMEAELDFREGLSEPGEAAGIQPSLGVGSAGGITAPTAAVAEGGESSLSAAGGAAGGPSPPGSTAAPGDNPVTPAAVARRSSSAGGGPLPTSSAANTASAAYGFGGVGWQGGSGGGAGDRGGGSAAAGSVTEGVMRSLWMAPTLRDMLEASSARGSISGGARVGPGETGEFRVLSGGSGDGNGAGRTPAAAALPLARGPNGRGAVAEARAVGGRGGGGGVVEIDLTHVPNDSSDGNEDTSDDDTSEGEEEEEEGGERVQDDNRDVWMRMWSPGSDDGSTSQSSGDQVRSGDEDGGGDGWDWDSWA